MKGIGRGLAIVAGLAATAPGQAQWTGQYSPVKPGPAVAYAPGTALPPGLWKRTRKDDVHGAARVVIPYFQVQFVTESKVSSNRSFASLSQDVQLAGLSDTDMRGIADALYDKFVADLAARNIQVVPLADAVKQSPALAKLMAGAQVAPFKGRTNEGTTSTIVSARGTPLYFHIGDPRMGSMANIGSRAYWDQPQAATELDAALVGVRIGTDFVEQATSDKRGFMGMRSQTAKVHSGVSMTIEPVTTHMWIQAPGMRSKIVGQPIEPVRYYLTSPLTLPDDAVTAMEDTTTRGQKRGDAIGSVAMLMLGGGIHKNSHKSFTVTVNPDRFRDDVGGAMGAVEQSLATQLKSDLTGG